MRFLVLRRAEEQGIEIRHLLHFRFPELLVLNGVENFDY